MIAREPILRAVRHSLHSLVSVLLALLVGATIMLADGINPLVAYASLLKGAFGGRYEVAETLAKASPLLLTGLATVIAFRSGFWNIGAEGQLHVGAVAATWVGLTFSLPTPAHITLAILMGFLAGAAYAALPGALKARLGVNEILVTLMMNYIAAYFVSYLLENPWRDPSGITYSPPLPDSARFPSLIRGTRLHVGILLSVLMAFLVHFLIKGTVLGYEIRAVGKGREAARCSGIRVGKVLLLSSALSGGLAGLAGVGEICGIQHRLLGGFSPYYGFLGIIVALLARLEPLGTIGSSLFLGALFVGADAMQRGAGVPVTIIYILQGLTLMFLLISENFSALREVIKR